MLKNGCFCLILFCFGRMCSFDFFCRLKTIKINMKTQYKSLIIGGNYESKKNN